MIMSTLKVKNIVRPVDSDAIGVVTSVGTNGIWVSFKGSFEYLYKREHLVKIFLSRNSGKVILG